jgi:hypothetical protein
MFYSGQRGKSMKRQQRDDENKKGGDGDDNIEEKGDR